MYFCKAESTHKGPLGGGGLGSVCLHNGIIVCSSCTSLACSWVQNDFDVDAP